eukprot:CAMPEP_0201614532 /NCGR_PEP_ID=MMETSP0492-20130828/28972_1 /ASSEMBLY_ACC=CAM_ASM_000837 /TAXON_ID=420259 /ORGANISM="Thalassiosira gravida, Strain GMp14c1" /LENGTH=45 /DNA_ID= /DNA_START= /DNA_END= /DNA_ORIENTATION=
MALSLVPVMSKSLLKLDTEISAPSLGLGMMLTFFHSTLSAVVLVI